MLHNNGLDKVVCRELKLRSKLNLTPWKELIRRINGRKKHVTVALVGKYVKLHDSYLSVVEALYSAGYENGCYVDIKWVDSEEVTPDTAAEIYNGVDGIIVPGGFGSRGIEGMIETCRYAREHDLPYFGICLGMQIMVMEYARHVCNLDGATSGEFDENAKYKVIDLMPDQQGNIPKGGTMRLGAYPCSVKQGTQMRECYGADEISERHRHRYEFNNDYRKVLEDNGLVLSGISPDGRIVETVEVEGDRFFVGAQFHPEFKSRPNRSHPLFRGFIASCLKTRNK